MGRKRKVGLMLPEHVHRVKWKSGTYAYYFQMHRGTAKAGPRVRLPDNPASSAFFRKIEEIKRGPQPAGSLFKMIEAYQDSPKYNELAVNTRREYDRHMKLLRVLAEAIEVKEADDLLISHVATFRDELGKKPAKANAFVKAIASAYAWGTQRGFAKANPATGVDMLKIGEYKPWTEEIWQAAIAHFRPEIVTACYLGRYTGQRLGDCLKMRFADITRDDDGTEGIQVIQQKTGRELFIPLLTVLMPAIAAARRPGREFIVCREDGTPYTVDQFHARWSFDTKKPEIAIIKEKDVSFHGLRKMKVVSNAESGLTGHEIGSLTGQTLSTVQHYSRGARQKALAKAATKKLEGNG